MANPLEIVKKHPIATGVVVVVVIGAVLLFSGGGGDATYTDTSSAGAGDELSASMAMANINAQLSARSMELATQKEVALNENATSLQMAQLAKDAAIQTGNWNYQLEEARIAAQERALVSTNTLTATLKQRELDNEAAATSAQFATIQAQSAALLESQKINAQTQLGIVKEQNKPKGLFSFLFG